MCRPDRPALRISLTTCFWRCGAVPYAALLSIPLGLMSIPHIQRWPDLGKFWTIPNALSLSRLALVVPITALIWQDGSLDWLFGLVMAAILTDWFDGRVARWLDTESEWGKVLDPIADKIGAIATVSALTFRSADPTLPMWFFGALMSRDVLILAGSLLIVRRSGQVAASVWAGKAATFWLAVTVLAAVLKADPPVLQFCVWMTTALLGTSFFVYLVRYLNAARREPPLPNPPSLSGIHAQDTTQPAGHVSLDAASDDMEPMQDAPDDLTDPASRSGDGEPGRTPETPAGTDAGPASPSSHS